MTEKKRFIVTAGGTGGHIFPALAIAAELLARGNDVLFVGNQNSMEEKIVGSLGIPFRSIDVQRLYRYMTPRHLIFPLKLLKSYKMSGDIINRFKPDACIGTGGFVSGPVIFRAAMKKIPVFIQEQNSAAGLTTKILSKFAQLIFLGFREAVSSLPPSKCVYTGNPLRKEMLQFHRQDAASGASDGKVLIDSLTLLIIGGSQGAKVINNRVLELLQIIFNKSKERLPEPLDSIKRFHIIWQCGDRSFPYLQKALQNIKWDTAQQPVVRCSQTDADVAINVSPGTERSSERSETSSISLFTFTDSINRIYELADIAVTRAGAISLSELEVYGIPAVIIPIPKSAGNHQYLNAKTQEINGRGILLNQSELSPESLVQSISKIAANIAAFRRNISASSHRTATKEIVDSILKRIESKK